MTSHTFLVELGTEELPPTQLKPIIDDFERGFIAALDKANLSYQGVEAFATPRRIALLVTGLADRTASQVIEKRGPALSACYDANHELTKAAQGWLRANNITIEQASEVTTDKGAWLYYQYEQPGLATTDIIANLVYQAIANIQIAKGMRWSDHEFTFIRPVHTLTMMLDDQVIPGEIFGVKSDNLIYGHRFMGTKSFRLAHAQDYVDDLTNKGRVFPSFAVRKQIILTQAQELAKKYHGFVNISDELLEEITALVEYPNVLVADFEPEFLAVPKEALVHTMQGDQRYFPLFANASFTELLSHFIFVSNIDPEDSSVIIQGNEKVIRPRLTDAKFFYEQDLKQPLSSHLPKLKTVVFQKQLGTVYDKTLRLQQITRYLAPLLHISTTDAERAAMLSKCDLMTNMVFEFTDTQGIMGRYYAEKSGENDQVSQALYEQYLPKFAGDILPGTAVGTALALADKFDTLVGIFGIGQPPKGAKDPFALRRAAIGILRILVEKQVDLDLKEILSQVIAIYHQANVQLTVTDNDLIVSILNFFNGRTKSLYEEQGFTIDELQALQNLKITNPYDFYNRLQAIHQFKTHSEAAEIIAVNKRVRNFVSKSDFALQETVNSELFATPVETTLYQVLQQIQPVCQTLYQQKQYDQVLAELSKLLDVTNQFFDQVIINAEDLAVKQNRYALLARLNYLFTLVADLSALS